MSAIFRNSLFGFNKEDVLKYIESTTAQHSKELHAAQNEIAKIKSELNNAQSEVAAWRAKEQELEQLSVAIGKLYLIAKSNSEKIIQDARENLELSKAESQKNMQGIEAVQAQLQDLYAQLYASGSAFGEELNRLNISLADTKQILNHNQDEIEQSDTVLQQLINESAGAK